MTRTQLFNSVNHLNEIIMPNYKGQVYLMDEIAGTDKYTLWLCGHDSQKILTADGATMYQALVAIKHVYQNL